MKYYDNIFFSFLFFSPRSRSTESLLRGLTNRSIEIVDDVRIITRSMVVGHGVQQKKITHFLFVIIKNEVTRQRNYMTEIHSRIL